MTITRADLRGLFYLSWFMFLVICMEVIGLITRITRIGRRSVS